MQATRNRSCPICGDAAAYRVFTESNLDLDKLDGFAFASRKYPEYMYNRLLECRGCDALYASPVPTSDTLFAAYHSADFDSSSEAKAASSTYAELLHDKVATLPDRVGALDIGTGDGAFLEKLLAMDFSEVVGIEPSDAPITAASDQVRPLIRKGFFDDGMFPANSFRLVTCFQTLEHVEKPMEVCREAFRLLKPGGVMFVVVHDRRAWSAKLLGRKSPIYDIEHLQLFSKSSAEALLRRAGFADVKVETVVNRYPVHYWTKLLPFPNALKKPLVTALQSSSIGRLPVAIAAGNLALFAYKR